ncbi:bone marrow stromal antigen 2 [Apodemus sylvaticus]|uniref:bone marrow stromal antigen 2 n=1 Tax=Apodemus sylvaticus TaxID=10129 RepID=UPI0022449C13|nr:bone marrow stromal antigen 2 [Apodemus sylvaticus]
MVSFFTTYLSVPTDEMGEKHGWGIRRRWLAAAILVLLLGVILVTLTIYFAITSYRQSSKDGLRAQDECRNTTHLLQRQLTRTQDSLLQAETQANSCNQTVVALQDALEKKVAQALEQQALISELKDEVMMLKQELQSLRTQKEAPSSVQVSSGCSTVLSSLLLLTMSLCLAF